MKSVLRFALAAVLVGARALAAESDPPTPARVGFMTGTFDPPHLGHEALVNDALQQFGITVFYLVPNEKPGHKPNANPYAVRKELAELAFSQPNVIVADPEIEQTIRDQGRDAVLPLLRRRFPQRGTRFFEIMGDDTFQWVLDHPETPTWADRTYVVSERKTAEAKAALPQKIGLSPVAELRSMDEGLSSTRVRAQIARGETPSELKPAVWKRIQELGLYGAKPAEPCPLEDLFDLTP